MNKRLNAKVGAGVLLLAATGEAAFGPPAACCGNKVRYDVFSRGTTTTISHSTGVLLLSKMDDEDSVAHDLGRRAFVGAISAAALLGVKVSSAYAASSVPTSSMYIAEAVKTMDMSLPSYGSVIDPVSGASNVPTIDPFEAGKGVGVMSKSRSTTPKKQPPPPKKKAEKTSSSSGGGGGGGFSIGFPSMSSSSDKPKKEVAKKQQQKVENPPKPEKEQEQKEKELVIVDTTMPSYSDSAATKEKSVFSL